MLITWEAGISVKWDDLSSILAVQACDLSSKLELVVKA